MDITCEHRIQLHDVTAEGGVRVRLRLRDRDVIGVSQGTDACRAAARAALDAVQQLTPSTLSFRLDTLQILPPAERVPTELIVVVVTAIVAGTALPHAGSALVTDSRERAAAAAVIDALNRRLAVLGI